MISSLSHSLRAISLNNAAKKSILPTVQLLCIPLRFKSVEEKLGLPAKPKKPIAPYFRFANENRPSVTAKHPKLKPFEISSILGKMWQSMDASDRVPYTKGYKTDLINYYSNEYTKYKSSLSADDKLKIKEMKIEIKKRRILAAKERELRKCDKPKKPLSSFFKYLTCQKDRKLKEPYKDYVKRVTVRWDALSDAEKEKYKTPAEEEAKYKKAQLQWEQKMQKLEHDGIVRGTTNKELPRSPVGSKK